MAEASVVLGSIKNSIFLTDQKWDNSVLFLELPHLLKFFLLLG